MRPHAIGWRHRIGEGHVAVPVTWRVTAIDDEKALTEHLTPLAAKDVGDAGVGLRPRDARLGGTLRLAHHTAQAFGERNHAPRLSMLGSGVSSLRGFASLRILSLDPLEGRIADRRDERLAWRAGLDE